MVLDPITAAPVKAALEAMVTDALHCRRDHDGDGGSGAAGGARYATGADSMGADSAGAVITDTRTIPQMQADALAELARHCLGCTELPHRPPRPPSS